MESTTINCPSRQASVGRIFSDVMRAHIAHIDAERVRYYAKCTIQAIACMAFGFTLMWLAAILEGGAL